MTEDDPRERLEDSLKTPYPPTDNLWEGLIEGFGSEFGDHQETLGEVNRQKFVETADGEPLNKIADLYELDRRSDESVDTFRARIKAALRSQHTSATIPQLRDIISVIVGTDSDEVEVVEPFDLRPANILIDVPRSVLDDSDISDDEFVEIIDQVVAAGVGVGISIEYEFSEDVVLEDDGRAHIEKVDVGHWNEGYWDISTSNIGSLEISISADDEIALSDIGFVKDPITRTEDVVLEDDGAVSEAVVGVATALLETDGRVRDSVTGTDATAIGDSGSVQQPVSGSTDLVVTDDARAHLDEVSVGYWGEGRWDIDVSHVAEVTIAITPEDGVVTTDAGYTSEAIRGVDGIGVEAAGFVRQQVSGIDELAATDSHRTNIEEIQPAYWNEGRWNIDTTA